MGSYENDGDLHKITIKNVLVLISKSNLLYKAATYLPANEQERPCVEQPLHSARPAAVVCRQRRAGRCMLSVGSHTAAPAPGVALEICT